MSQFFPRRLPLLALALVLAPVLGLGVTAEAAAADDAALEARVTKLEQSLNNRGLIELLSEIETLKREVAGLRGELENQAYLIEQAKRVQSAGYADLDARLQAMGAGVPPSAPPPPLQVLQGSPVETLAGTPAPQGNLQVQNQPTSSAGTVAASGAPLDASGMPAPPPAIDPATGLPMAAAPAAGWGGAVAPGAPPMGTVPQAGVYPPSGYPPANPAYPPAQQMAGTPGMPPVQPGMMPGTPPGQLPPGTPMAGQAQGAVPPGAPMAAPGTAPGIATGVDEAAAERAYQAAFSLLKSGEYDQAIASFANFQQQFPGSQFGDNAQYWMAEAYYVKGDFAKALPAYQTMLATYPASKKLSHAMLKIGYSYAEMGKTNEARAVLADVQQRFPGSAAAQLAGQRLAKLPAAKKS